MKKLYKGDTFANLMREYALDRAEEDSTFHVPTPPPKREEVKDE